jgi:NAD(P)-dependent dehydrogenase (short-subunit alcohol dehydrogenase family)
MKTFLDGVLKISRFMQTISAVFLTFKRDETPDDLMGMALFLASDGSDFVTGQTFIVDGGAVFQ